MTTDYAFENLTALVVDQTKQVRDLVTTILQMNGFRDVHTATDVIEALEDFKHFVPDLIVTDWNFPSIDGIELVRTVRTAEDSPKPDVAIVMLTGFTDLLRVTVARDAGVNEFLAKPFSSKALCSRVASIINNPRAFIQSKSYVGPDRRRSDRQQQQTGKHGERRQSERDKITAARDRTAVSG